MAEMRPAVSTEETEWHPAQVAAPAVVLPTIEPCEPFQYGFHPDSWRVDDDLKMVVPSLLLLVAMPGVNHVGAETGHGGGRVGTMNAIMAERGVTVLPVDIAGGSYVKRVRVARGYAFIPAWDIPIPGSDRTRRDPEVYARVMQAIVAAVPPPETHVLEGVLDQLAAAHATAFAAAATDPRQAATRDLLQRRIDIVRAALNPSPAPVPTPQRARKGAED